MENANSYAKPGDIGAPMSGDSDQSSPFSPSGRFTRLSYIAWGLALGLVTSLLAGLIMGAGLVDLSAVDGNDPLALYQNLPLTVIIPMLLVYIVVAVIGIIFVIRRLHDFNASGWWSLLFLVPIANFVMSLLVLFKRGSEGANRFGPPRPTPTWERIVGIIGVALFVLMLVGVVVSIAIPAFMVAQQANV